MGNPFKKAVNKVVHAVKKYGWNALDVATLGLSYPIRKNWSDVRTPLLYSGIAAAAAFTGGAALGALGIGTAGLTGAAGAAAGAAGATGAATIGATVGSATGVQANEAEKAAARAAKEQERIAAAEAEAQRKLALQRAGATPDAVTDLNTEARRRMRSQAQRNMISRNNSNKLGGSSSTLA